MSDWPLLSLLIWLPLLGGIGLLMVGERYARWAALGIAMLGFLLSLLLYILYDLEGAIFQFEQSHPWIDAFGISINYSLGVDGIAIPLILLNTFITLLVVVASWEATPGRSAEYMAAFIIMSGLVNGVFSATDAILFYIFFEAMLIPLFLIIGIWGGERRVYATLKFFLYTFTGSVLFLISLIYLYVHSSSFAIADLQKMVPVDNEIGQIFVFFAFLFAFGVKIPMWPIHTWLPDAHVEAPTSGSVVLAAITLKVGGYAFLRFILPVTEEVMMQYDWVVILLSLWAIVYIGFVALVQEDIKKLIAYSSIAHMGFVTLSFFLVFHISENMWPGPNTDELAIQGGIIQMISHGFISAALFLCIGMLYDRMHTREIRAYGGIANRMPVFAGFFVFFAVANAGLPGTSGFVGEFMVIMASLKANIWIAAAAALTLIIGAAYMLWLIKRVLYGEVLTDAVDKLTDLNRREYAVLAVLALAILCLGLWPQPLTELMEPSIRALLDDMLLANQTSVTGLGE